MGSRRAVVQKVIIGGRHGPYAVALSDDMERLNITFALTEEVWGEKHTPEPGSFVMLSRLSRKRAGWRANSGRFLQSTDEQPANYSKEQ